MRPLLEWLFPSASDELITVYQGYVRKIAHFVIYAGLAFWAARAYLGSSREVLRRQWAAFVLLLVLTVATLDEINQSFNSLRTGSPYDVLLDLSGATAMILLIVLIRRIFR